MAAPSEACTGTGVKSTLAVVAVAAAREQPASNVPTALSIDLRRRKEATLAAVLDSTDAVQANKIGVQGLQCDKPMIRSSGEEYEYGEETEWLEMDEEEEDS